MTTATTDIEIQVKLYATLTRHTRFAADSLTVPSNATVQGIVDKLALPQEQIKLIFINGRKGSLETILQNGDRLGLFPPVGGG